MKILHVLSQRPDSTGSGIYLQAMLRESRRVGHDCRLVAGIPPGDPPDLDMIAAPDCFFVRFEEDLDFPIVGMSDVMPYASTRFGDLTPEQLERYRQVFTEALQQAVSGFTPDVIHANHLWILTATARELLPDTPLVASCHGSDLRQFRTREHLRPLVQQPCRRLDGVLALSQVQREEIVELYGIERERIHLVGAGYNESLFRCEEKPPADPVAIVYAGKLARAKGVPWLLRALRTIDGPDWRLHLVGGGSGDEKNECLDLATDLGDRVVTHGPLPQPELAELLRRSHVFVLPSLFEGLPLVLLEALACGCRLVATRLPGVDEVLGGLSERYLSLVPVPPLDGIDTPAADAEGEFTRNIATALSTQLAHAYATPQLSLQKISGHLHAFSWSQVFSRVDSVYRAVTDR